MAVNGQAYPVELLLPDGRTLTGTLQFTDATEQPGSGGGGGGLPTGWTINDPSDGDLNANNGALFLGNGGIDAGDGAGVQGTFAKNAIECVDNAGSSFVQMDLEFGVLSTPTGATAFVASGDAGATIALDAGGLTIVNAGDISSDGTVDADALGPTITYVTDGTANPTTYVTPLVLNHTAVTGGLYAWSGAAYVKVGGALS